MCRRGNSNIRNNDLETPTPPQSCANQFRRFWSMNILSVLLFASVSSSQTCRILSVRPQAGVPIPMEDVVGFTLSQLSDFELVDPTDGVSKVSIVKLGSYVGDIVVLPGGLPLVVMLKTEMGGQVSVETVPNVCDTILIGPFAPRKFFHMAVANWNYYTDVIQMTGGTLANGEYYKDLDGAEIHLHPNATAQQAATDNWFVVPTGTGANLLVEPTKMAAGHVGPVAGPGLIREDEAIALRAMYGNIDTYIGPNMWVVPKENNNNDKPYFTVEQSYPYGVAAYLLTQPMGQVVYGPAHYRSFVLSADTLKERTASPEPTPLPLASSATSIAIGLHMVMLVMLQ